MRRDNLYRMLNGESSPAFATVITVLLALDIRFEANPAGARTEPRRPADRHYRAAS